MIEILTIFVIKCINLFDIMLFLNGRILIPTKMLKHVLIIRNGIENKYNMYLDNDS